MALVLSSTKILIFRIQILLQILDKKYENVYTEQYPCNEINFPYDYKYKNHRDIMYKKCFDLPYQSHRKHI